MRVDEFRYALPPELIAQKPLTRRESSRMLVLDRASGNFEDRVFREFPSFLSTGDCLVLNDTRVIPARLFGRRRSGESPIEVLLIRQVRPGIWEALVKPGRKAMPGEVIAFSENLSARVLDKGERGLRVVDFGEAPLLAELERIGHVPLPPYMKRPDTAADKERYQTVFARELGSAAAPTAGLHFTSELLAECEAAGALLAFVTLHVGLGTFAPVRVETVEEIRLHAETYAVSRDSLARMQGAKRRIAVGTTSVRAMESVYASGALSGETSLFISPGYRFQAVDVLITNFHLPESSLLMLVCAFGGRELVMDAYRHAVRQRYRFFSYGDCMLIL